MAKLVAKLEPAWRGSGWASSVPVLDCAWTVVVKLGNWAAAWDRSSQAALGLWVHLGRVGCDKVLARLLTAAGWRTLPEKTSQVDDQSY
jgi:hypothetical protein